MNSYKNDGLFAFFYAAAFSALLSIMWVIVRKLSETIHPLEIPFWASIFGLLIFIPTIVKEGVIVLETQRAPLHFLRALFNGSAVVAWFWAITLIPLADAAALNLIAPLLITIGAIIFFGEKVGLRRWGALIFGGLGALVVVRPGFQELDLGMFLVAITVVLSAGQRLLSKELIKTDSSSTCVIYLMAFMVPINLVPAIPVWTTPSLTDFPLLILVGLLLSLAHFTWMKAVKLADISALEPINFTRLIYGSAFGFLFFAEIPTGWTWLGGIMIIFSTTYISRREAALRTSH